MYVSPLAPPSDSLQRRAGGVSPAMGFPSLRALDKQLLVAAHPPEASALNRVSEEQVSGVSLGEKRKKERGICNQNFTAGIETKLQNHHPFFKVFPHSSTKPECQKNSQWEKKNGKHQKRTHSPKSRPPNTPNTDKHTQNPKKEGGRKKNRQRTKHTQQTSYCYSLENCSSNPNPREKKKQQPKTSRKTHSN